MIFLGLTKSKDKKMKNENIFCIVSLLVKSDK